VHQLPPCCCNQAAPAEGDSSPSEPPAKSSCQGVCGGAVIEQSLQLDDEIDDCGIASIENATSSSLKQLPQCLGYLGHYGINSGDNLGRSLRALFASFLC